MSRANGVGRYEPVIERPGIHKVKKICAEPKCPDFGQKHERCVGHVAPGGRSNTRRPCRRWPTPGQTRCPIHGGATKKALLEGEVRIMAAAVTYGDPVKISPHAALLEELYRTQGHVNWLAQQVKTLAPEDLIWGTASALKRPLSRGKEGEDERVRVREIKKESKPNTWLDLYMRERKHLAEVSALCIRAGIEERQTRVIEAQAVILAQVIRTVLGDQRLAISAPASVQSQVVREAMDRMNLIEVPTT